MGRRLFKFDQGARVRDTISGFEGTVTARLEYLNGCVRYGVTARNEKPTEEPREYTFDEDQLRPVKAPRARKGRPSGGPMPAPARTGHGA